MSDLTKISFAYPSVLLLLALPLLYFFWEVTRPGVRVRLPFDYQGEAALRPRRRRFLGGLVVAANLLPGVVLACAILVLAGPRRTIEGGREKQMTNIQICLDISGSMMSPFGSQGNRYDAAMQAVSDFTGYRKGDAFGLTLFGTEVLHWVPLTKDTDAIRRATPFVRPELMPQQFGGTLIGFALSQCRTLLSRSTEGDRMILLITDGYSGDIVGQRGDELAQELRADRIVVYPICVAGEAAPAALESIAAITGGEVFAAGDPAALDVVFKRIDAMQAGKLKPPGQVYEDFFAPFAWAGAASAALHALTLAMGLRFAPW